MEKAYALLEKDDLIQREPGCGVFVNHPAPRLMTGNVGYADPIGTYASWRGYNIGDKNYVPHFDGANVAFTNGHVKWMKQAQPFTKSTSPKRKIPLHQTAKLPALWAIRINGRSRQGWANSWMLPPTSGLVYFDPGINDLYCAAKNPKYLAVS